MVGWTNTETFQFIEMYQNEPCVWNPKHKHYKDKIRVYDAWLRIANAMGVSDVVEIKKKKETLLSAFRLNHKKVIASRKSGKEVFKPIWVFYDALAAFLTDVYERKSTLTSEHIEPNDNSEGEVDSTRKALHKQPNRFINDIPKKSSRPVRKYSSELPENRKHLDTPISKLSKIRSNDERTNTDTTLGQMDEFQIYGLYVANQLKSLSEKQSLIAREKIQSILTQCRLQDLRKRKTLSSKNATSFHSEDEIENVQIVLSEESDKYKSKISSSNLNSEIHLDSDTDILEDNFIMHVEDVKGEGSGDQDSDSDE
ncbi:uncharacterized protein LOC133518684 [Cydia pomonella]|uniref:uncharacterized protein LOC133518684 n=1 Tax=Cydia pomonella TaxID=82600 RepID=UPI002ADD951D|nr:uncharacterized protein LOC133518684 [Cydia pomonella]